MSIPPELLERAGHACELCASTEELTCYQVKSADKSENECAVVVCKTCRDQITGLAPADADHWQCLSTSMWSEVPAVKVLSWRILKLFSSESWASELMDMMYLEDDLKDWAEAEKLGSSAPALERKPTRDCNGTELHEGDNVTLIKDLQVKGAGFTAKRGTMVRNIRLTDNPEHIEGKVGGQQIVLVSAFLKKA